MPTVCGVTMIAFLLRGLLEADINGGLWDGSRSGVELVICRKLSCGRLISIPVFQQD